MVIEGVPVPIMPAIYGDSVSFFSIEFWLKAAFNFCLCLCRWAVGVLIYFMLQGEMPFGSWRDSELDTFAKIAKGQLNLPSNFGHEAVELITQLLEVDESSRLGSLGPDSIKNHPWFDGIDWKGIRDRSLPVPREITSRVAQHLESHSVECTAPLTSQSQDLDDLNAPEWLDDW